MAEYDLEVGVSVEEASKDQSQRRQSGVEVPPPPERGQGEVVVGIESARRRITNGSRWQLRMDEKWSWKSRRET